MHTTAWADWLPKTSIFTGSGAAEELLRMLPENDLVVLTGAGTAARPGLARQILHTLKERRGCRTFALNSEPSDLWIDSVRNDLRGVDVSAVVSLGGGSVLDAGKALAAMLQEPKPTRSYLEGVGDTSPSGVTLDRRLRHGCGHPAF